MILLFLFALTGCGADGPVQRPERLTVESPFEYPLALWDRGVEGETVLLVHVTPSGAVDTVAVRESSGYAAFDSAAVANAYKLRFSPARRGGEPVGMWIEVPVRYRRDRGAAPSGALGGTP